jgi:rubredoxin
MTTETTDPNFTDADFLDRYECQACGYIYEPMKGDDKGRIPPNTPFKALPNDWRCPVCGARTSRFSDVGVKGSPSGFKENLGYGFGVNTLTPGQKNLLIFGGLLLAFLFFMSFYGMQ